MGPGTRLPKKGNSNSHGARPVHLIITMIKWIRTSKLSIKNSLLGPGKDRGVVGLRVQGPGSRAHQSSLNGGGRGSGLVTMSFEEGPLLQIKSLNVFYHMPHSDRARRWDLARAGAGVDATDAGAFFPSVKSAVPSKDGILPVQKWV